MEQPLAGMRVIEVGGTTEMEQKERQGRVEDALSATQAAVEEGVVPGGGVALLRASAQLRHLSGENPGETMGIEIVRSALEEPIRTIAENAGFEGPTIVRQVLDCQGADGFNAETGVIEDLDAVGVIDATKVTRSALQNAASIGSLILTTETLVADKPASEGDNG